MCDALQKYMTEQKITVTDSTTASTCFTEGYQCISKHKSNCFTCKERPYTQQCLFCLQYECSVTPGSFCCPQLQEALTCDNYLANHQNTTSSSSLLLPVWAIIIICVGAVFLILIGLLYYYKSFEKTPDTTKLY
jgi:hypothetical protein